MAPTTRRVKRHTRCRLSGRAESERRQKSAIICRSSSEEKTWPAADKGNAAASSASFSIAAALSACLAFGAARLRFAPAGAVVAASALALAGVWLRLARAGAVVASVASVALAVGGVRLRITRVDIAAVGGRAADAGGRGRGNRVRGAARGPGRNPSLQTTPTKIDLYSTGDRLGIRDGATPHQRGAGGGGIGSQLTGLSNAAMPASIGLAVRPHYHAPLQNHHLQAFVMCGV